MMIGSGFLQVYEIKCIHCMLLGDRTVSSDEQKKLLMYFF